MDGGGDRVRLSRELERDAIEAGLIPIGSTPTPRGHPSSKSDGCNAVARLQSFGGGFMPPAVAAEIEFRRRQLGLSQHQLASLVD